ncbi:MAG: hypothetical protein KatS3mg110_1385 [Pirellulaceae bacterium]|nr:MAG: hypothetical protein KatS3mg110_1385 [Pirellulaceae bacterium]
MKDFEDRLQEALRRGRQRGLANKAQHEQKQWTEEELRRRHTEMRLELSEHIEQALEKFAHQVPGFLYEPVFGERGWGAACYRDDLRLAPHAKGRGENLYSRLEITVAPFSAYHVVDLRAKGTVRNRELLERRYHMPIENASADQFQKRIDTWILEYAELYAADS